MRRDLNGGARAGVLDRVGDLLDDPRSLLAALSGHGDFAGGDDHEAHGLALGGLEVGIEGLDGSEAEVVVGALQGHSEEVSDALGVGPCPPLSGERVAFDERFERLPVVADGGEGLLLAFGAFEGRSRHGWAHSRMRRGGREGWRLRARNRPRRGGRIRPIDAGARARASWGCGRIVLHTFGLSSARVDTGRAVAPYGLIRAALRRRRGLPAGSREH